MTGKSITENNIKMIKQLKLKPDDDDLPDHVDDDSQVNHSEDIDISTR